MSEDELQQKIEMLNLYHEHNDDTNFQRLYLIIQKLVWCDYCATGGFVYRIATPYERGYRVWQIV
jgi:hypothetical protein